MSPVKRRLAFVAAGALAIVLVAAPAASATAWAPDFCHLGGMSQFTPSVSGRWVWAWYAGTRKIRSGTATLEAGVPKSVATPAYNGSTMTFVVGSMSDGGSVACN